MTPEVEKALESITRYFERLRGYASLPTPALSIIRRALIEGSVDRTARETLAADLVALADGKPVVTALAAAVAYKIAQKLANAPTGCEFCNCETCGAPRG